MSYKVNPTELESVFALSPAKRYDYLIKKIVDWQECWSIGTENSWVLYGDSGGNQLVPIWPAREYASTCCVLEWSSKHPKRIELSVWLEKWLPRIAFDNRLVAAFPTTLDKGIALDPARMRQDIDSYTAEWY